MIRYLNCSGSILFSCSVLLDFLNWVLGKFPLERDWFSINTIQFTIFKRLLSIPSPSCALLENPCGGTSSCKTTENSMLSSTYTVTTCPVCSRIAGSTDGKLSFGPLRTIVFCEIQHDVFLQNKWVLGAQRHRCELRGRLSLSLGEEPAFNCSLYVRFGLWLELQKHCHARVSHKCHS